MLLFIGCDRSPPSTTPPSKFRVLATVYPLADVAKRVAGDYADVQWLIESGQTLDGVSDVDLRERASQSRLVVTSGPADDWAQQGMGIDARTVRLVEPQNTTATRDLYGGGNPDPKASLWLDPKSVSEMTELIRQRLVAADQAHEQTYTKNAATVRQSLEQLDAEIRRAISALPEKRLLTIRPVWSAFGRRYGLEPVAPVQSREERLTEDEYRALKAAKAAGHRTVFVDVSTPATVRQQIADRTALEVLTLDTLGSSAPEGRSTYEKMMRYNLRQIVKGLNAK
jgi:ABC-type Zn uptake system ZnuABC Zn-binding protein ZnuA